MSTDKKLSGLHITAEEFAENSIANMANIPSRPSAFGAASLTPTQVKERFDANPELIRQRFNELLAMLPDVAGEVSVTVNVNGANKTVTLTELVASLSAPKGALQMQDILKVTYGGVDKTIREIVDALTRGINQKVDAMSVVDQRRIDSYSPDEYYFSNENWKKFIGDEENSSDYPGMNRVYVERGCKRGTYGMYSLSYNANPIYNAWYSKAEWAQRFAKEHPTEAFREPFPNEYPVLDSVVQRINNGQIKVPYAPIDGADATSKEYVDKIKAKLEEAIANTDEGNLLAMLEEARGYIELLDDFNKRYAELMSDIHPGTKGLAYSVSADGTYVISTGLGDVPTGSDIEFAEYYDELPVKAVKSGAFSGKNLKSVTVPPSIEAFEYNAFGWSTSIGAVYIKNLEKWLQKIRFESSGSPVTFSKPKVYIKNRYYTTLEIPAGVEKVTQRACMHWAQFEKIRFPETLKNVEDMGFQYCTGLKEVTLPTSLEILGAEGFGRCSSLTNVYFNGKPTISTTAFAGDDAIRYIHVPWQPGEVSGASWGANYAEIIYGYSPGTEGLQYQLSSDGTYYICDGFGENYSGGKDIVIPSHYNGKPVKAIGDSAFYGERWGSFSVTSVVIPETVEILDYRSFASQFELTSVTIKGTPTRIAYYAFDRGLGAEAYGDTIEPCTYNLAFGEGAVSGAPWGDSNAILNYNAEV